MTLSDSIVWMEVPDARESMGGLPALSYYLDGCFDYYRAGVRTFVLSSSPQWMGYDPPGDAKAYGDLVADIRDLLPGDARLLAGIRPLKAHLSSMFDVAGWKALASWIQTRPKAGELATVVLDMETIFNSGRFQPGKDAEPLEPDWPAWIEVLRSLPVETDIQWNLPCIMDDTADVPNRHSNTTLMCVLLRYLRPNDKLMDSSVAWASGSDVLIDAWNQRREWMMQLGEERILDRMLVSPNAMPFSKNDADYFVTEDALTEIVSRGDRPQVLWTDAERWIAVAAEMREAL